jgi:hypothetical protein
MTTTNTPRPSGRRAARYAALCLLALLALLCRAQDARAQWTTSGTNTTTTNNVGVGTPAPEAGLHISTSSIVPGNRGIIDEQTSSDGTAATFLFRKSRAGAAVQNGDNIGHMSGAGFDGTSFITATRLRFVVDGAVSAGNVPMGMQFLTGTNGSGLERMRITSAGNVGIGTDTPGVLNGINYGTYIPLHIKGQGSVNALVDSADPASGYVLNDRSQPVDNRIWAISQVAGGGKLTFSTYTDAGAPASRLVIDRAGNVGIGTAAPTSKLHVAGNVTIDGNINAKWQDVAEWVPSTQKLAAGTVVVVDAGGHNRVLASTLAYDTGVAGVVSAQPGLTLGEAGEGKALVATTGRVKVRVDATRAPIRAGDLLVTSGVEGVAMRSEPVAFGGVAMHRPGTIIGKALEPLASGTGEILVLLSLQ